MAVGAVLAGCGRLGFDARGVPDDSARGSDADGAGPADACVLGAWTAPIRIPGVNSAQTDWAPWISSDRLTLVFSSERAGSRSVYVTTRASEADSFASPTLTFDSGGNDDDPFLTGDLLTMWFDAATAGDYDLYVTTRASPTGAFGPPTSLGAVNRSGALDDCPELSPDLLTLYFSSDRAGNKNVMTAVRATPTGTFGAASTIVDVSSSNEDSCPTLGPDGTLYFASTRGGGAGTFQLWRAAPAGLGFSAPVRFDEASTVPARTDHDPHISSDGRTFVFASDRLVGGDFDLYLMQRDCL